MRTIEELKTAIHQTLVGLVREIKPLANLVLDSINNAIGSSWKVNDDTNPEFIQIDGFGEFEFIKWTVIDGHDNITEAVFNFMDYISHSIERIIMLSFSQYSEIVEMGFPVGSTEISAQDAEITIRLYEGKEYRTTRTQSGSVFLGPSDEVALRDQHIRRFNAPLSQQSWGAVTACFESLPSEYNILLDMPRLTAWHQEQKDWYEDNDCHEWYDYASLDISGDVVTFITPTSDRVVTVNIKEQTLSVYFPTRGSIIAAAVIADNLIANGSDAEFVSVREEKVTAEEVAKYLSLAD